MSKRWLVLWHGSDRLSNSSSSDGRCLTSTEDTDVYWRKVLIIQTDATYMQPLGAWFALYHQLAVIISRIADTASHFAWEAATIRARSSKIWIGDCWWRGIKSVWKGVAWRLRIDAWFGKISGGLCPTLIMSFEGPLRAAFCKLTLDQS